MSIPHGGTCVHRRPPGAAPRRDIGGYSLVEVMMAAVVVGVAVLGAVSAILSSVGLTRVNRDTAVARQAARRAIEEVQGVPLQEVFAAFNDTAADDAGLTVAASGADFAVAGLTPVFNDPDGMCGRITFPVAAGAPAVLREDVADPGLGMPLDLNLDGLIDGADHSGDYVLLPVRVQVQWRGPGGVQTTELTTVLTER
jgi:type II secretory pathway pseudopilin PulG